MEVRSPLSAKEIQDRHRYSKAVVTGEDSLPSSTVVIGKEKPLRPHVIVDTEDDPHKVLKAMENNDG